MKNLIIAPHIDDEILGCFALLNEDSFVCYMGVEDRSYVSAKERVMEMEEAAKVKGFKWTLFNNIVNSYSCDQMISMLEDQINRYRPKQVFIPNYSYNQDHRAVYDAAMVALRHHDVNWFVERIFVYEQPHTILWPYSNFEPNYFLQIDIAEKVSIYNLYRSQVRGHRSVDCIEIMARLRGKQANLEFAEAFHCLRYVQNKEDA
jgi:LmbE family N-acetylglucosaminyl deacetylase